MQVFNAAACTGGSAPLPNVWIGTSVENQAAADERIPILQQIPAAVRFLSIEPLLGPVDISRMLTLHKGVHWGSGDKCPVTPHHFCYCSRKNCHPIDWVIVGGESGPLGARPMHPDWARSLRDQCNAAGVPFFFKQWGEWAQESERNVDREIKGALLKVTQSGETYGICTASPDVYAWMRRVGKKAAGRVLDGRTWDEFPEVQS